MMALVIVKSKYLNFLSPDVIVCQELGVVFVSYLRNSVNFITCVNYSNSVCELLIIKINHPSLIVILIYRPPSCTTNEFNDIIVKVNQIHFFFVLTVTKYYYSW